MIWEGKEAVATGRKMLGATNPLESNPGTIRGDFCIEVSVGPRQQFLVDMLYSHLAAVFASRKSRLEETFATAVTASRMLKEKSICGLKMVRLWTGQITLSIGCTNKSLTEVSKH
jgi:hypothetical protein